MGFDVDRQTLNDLAILENGYSRQSIFNLFNNTRTIGGKERLEAIFNNAPAFSEHVKERIDVLRYLEENDTKFGFDKNTYDFIEFYLKKHYHNKSFSVITGVLEKVIYFFNKNNDYYIIQQGIQSTLKMLSELLKFATTHPGPLPKTLDKFRGIISNTFQSADFALINQLIEKESFNAIEIAKADHLFRQTAFDRIKTLLKIVYELDVYQSVNLSGKKLGFNLPDISDNRSNLIIKELFHPFVKDPVCNNVEFTSGKNVCFVTGTNMAGKSTLLKAIGISVYLSQLGFPVPASYMQTPIFKGLITTINLADDLDNGQSHFYKEVLRVKEVAEKINLSNDIFVIFDELFRGTNVKDAYDASLAIIAAFAKVKTCFFVVSTHLVEVAHDLNKIDNIEFQYMETLFKNDRPRYSYLLKTGITEERLGMWIVKNEKIIEIIENSLKKSS